MAAPANAHAHRQTVLVALTHEALNAGAYDSIADLIAEVKTRAARMRIPYDADGITEAINAVAHTRDLPLVRGVIVKDTPPPVEVPPEPPIIDREEAAAILQQLRDRTPKPPAAEPAPAPVLTEAERLQARVLDVRDRLTAAAKPSPTPADLQGRLRQLRERIENSPHWYAQQPLLALHCDHATADEQRTGRSDRVLIHRWPQPIRFGDRCYCGERTADAVLVKVQP